MTREPAHRGGNPKLTASGLIPINYAAGASAKAPDAIDCNTCNTRYTEQ